jgi:hypothetical protein
MEDATLDDVLLQLLEACHENEDTANALARQTDDVELKAFLRGSAYDYRNAESELSAILGHAVASRHVGSRQRPAALDATRAADVANSWECAECDALACFRDAFDSDLPPALGRTVRRHYEAGIARLERLRALRGHLS